MNIDQSLSFCQVGSPIDINNYIVDNIIIKNPTTGTKARQSIEYWECNPLITGSDATQNVQITNPVLICDSCVFTPGASLFDNDVSGLCSTNEWKYSAARVKDIPLNFYENPNSNCVKLINQPGRPFRQGNTSFKCITKILKRF